jgi:hypothetical protein
MANYIWCININDVIILFNREKHFEISARTWKIICVYTSDKDIDAEGI